MSKRGKGVKHSPKVRGPSRQPTKARAPSAKAKKKAQAANTNAFKSAKTRAETIAGLRKLTINKGGRPRSIKEQLMLITMFCSIYAVAHNKAVKVYKDNKEKKVSPLPPCVPSDISLAC